MELLDLAIEIERYLISKGLKASEITVTELLYELNKDGLEKLNAHLNQTAIKRW